MLDRKEPPCRKTATTAAPSAVTDPAARTGPEVVQAGVQTVQADPGTLAEQKAAPESATTDRVAGLRVGVEAKAVSPVTAGPRAVLPIAGHPVPMSPICPTR